jgi:hypothetical protein
MRWIICMLFGHVCTHIHIERSDFDQETMETGIFVCDRCNQFTWTKHRLPLPYRLIRDLKRLLRGQSGLWKTK